MKNKSQSLERITRFFLVFIIFLTLWFFISPFVFDLIAEYKKPSKEERLFLVTPESAHTIRVYRKSFFPFLGRNHITLIFSWPKDLLFSEWYKKELPELNPESIKVEKNSFQAIVPRNGNKKVKIKAEFDGKIVRYTCIF